MTQIVLLGDSVFDNGAYTRGAPDVVTHLRSLLPSASRATLLAVDGATTGGIAGQVRRVPSSVSHVVVSVGGNDALRNSDLLNTPVSSTSEALTLFDTRIARFERDYRGAIAEVSKLACPTVLCTIYNGQLPSARDARNARMALMMFNDVILRVASEHGMAVIDLRAVCDEPSDYANAIEPSGEGGAKIARAITQALGMAGKDVRVARIFGAS